MYLLRFLTFLNNVTASLRDYPCDLCCCALMALISYAVNVDFKNTKYDHFSNNLAMVHQCPV